MLIWSRIYTANATCPNVMEPAPVGRYGLRLVPVLCVQSVLALNITWLTRVVQRVAVQSLTIFAYNTSNLGKVLIQMALGSNTASTMAVQQSILAFLSIYRYNVYSRGGTKNLRSQSHGNRVSKPHRHQRSYIAHCCGDAAVILWGQYKPLVRYYHTLN